MKLEEVKKGYTRVARKYDPLLYFWFGKILHLEKYRKEAVEWLELREGDTVVDIGCGTGVNFPLLEEKIGNQGKIIGLDYTEAMLKEARDKIRRNRWTNITLIKGDAVYINELINTEVEAIISTCCFSILYDLEKAFLNTLKVLKPGGRIVILDAKKIKPDNKLISWIIYPIYRRITKRYGILSDEDLDEGNAAKKWELWQRVTKEKLLNRKQKELLWGMFFIFRGEKS